MNPEPQSHEFAELLLMIENLRGRVAKLESQDVPIKTKATLEEVQLCCAKCGLTDDDARWFWAHMESNGWRNNGKPVRRWQACIVAWKLINIFPSQKQGTNGNASVFGLKAALEAKERQARELSNRDYYPDQHQWSNEASRQQFIVLKKDIKSLTARIAQSV